MLLLDELIEGVKSLAHKHAQELLGEFSSSSLREVGFIPVAVSPCEIGSEGI